MEATDRLFISIDTCSNIDEVKKQFPDLDFLTYFYYIIGYYRISTSRIVEHVFMSKDEYFDIVDDDSIMQNHERGKKRPTYFTIKNKDILWFIPISSKVDKYKKIIDKKIEKYGFCNTIIIRRLADEDAAILLQNAFPTLEKYIDHVHTVDGVPLNVPTDLQNEIKSLFKNMIGLKKRGTNLFFTDIDSLKKKMLDEIK